MNNSYSSTSDDKDMTIIDAGRIIAASSSSSSPNRKPKKRIQFDGPLWRKLPASWCVDEDDDDDDEHRGVVGGECTIGDSIIPASQLSSANLERMQQVLLDEIDEEAREAQRLLDKAVEEHNQLLNADKIKAEETELAFMNQTQFTYSVPAGSTDYCLPDEGVDPATRCRIRPQRMAIPKAIPDCPSATLSSIEQEAQYAERLDVLRSKTEAIHKARDAAFFDAEEAMFEPSSDDSDGYDEDFQEEWRDLTNDIFSACRAVECNINDEEAFYTLGTMVSTLQDERLTPSEQEMLWNTLRTVYVKAEPIHPKHWFTSCSSILSDNGFASRPSITNWCFLLSKMAQVECFSSRRKRKMDRWKSRAVFLVRKRMIILREFGVAEPTWKQVHVSVDDYDRALKVPSMSIMTTLEALTANSAPSSLLHSSSAVVMPIRRKASPTTRR